MKRLLPASITVLALVLASPLLAELAVLKVRARVPRALVMLNGQYYGRAPIDFRSLKPGRYAVSVENADTGEFQVFHVTSPAKQRLGIALIVRFNAESMKVEKDKAGRRVAAIKAAKKGRRTPIPVTARTPVIKGGLYDPLPDDVAATPMPVRRRSALRKSPWAAGTAARFGATPVRPPRRRRRNRGKIRRRNAMIGAAALNELLYGRSSKYKRRRRDIRKSTLGAAVINELFTR